MSLNTDIKGFVEKATGNWVAPKTCNIGDVLLITSEPKIDNTSFEGKTYLVMDVRNERLPQNPMKLRLSGQQTQVFVPVFTDQAPMWIGKKIRIVAKQNYPGIGKEGFIYAPA